MSSSPKFSTHGEWRIVYGDQNEEEERVGVGRKTLAHTLSLPKSMCILSDSKTEIPTVTELDPPKLKLPQLGSDTVERVFPVRSVLTFDSTPSSALQTPSLDKLESPISPFSEEFRASTSLDEKPKGQLPHSPNELDNRTCGPKRPNYLSQLREQKHELGETSKSTLVLPLRTSGQSSRTTQLEELINQGGNVLETRNTPKGLQYPRHGQEDPSPEVQDFGVLLVLCELEGNLVIQAASDNSKHVIGYSLDELFELRSICDILTEPCQKSFVSHIENVLDDEYSVEVSGPEVFSVLIRNPRDHETRLWCTMHTSKTYQDYIICEFETESFGSDHLEATSIPLEETYGAPPSSYQPNPLREAESQSTKLSHHRKISTQAGTQKSEFDILNILTPIIRRISSSQTMDVLIDHVVSGLKSLIQMDRITMYHFDGNQNGVILADLVDSFSEAETFEGMGFDENTFTNDAKSQYLRNTICFSYSHLGDTSRLVYRSSTNQSALDSSHCYLTAAPESVSVSDREIPGIYCCMSIAINVFGKTWGLICCHSYDEKFRLHPLLQKVSWLMSETISSNIERLSYTLPFQPMQKSNFETELNSKVLGEPSDDLLMLFGADYGVASILGETKIVGKPPDSQEALALLEYLRAKDSDTVIWSTDILSDFEDLEYSPGFNNLTGLLYIPLSARRHDFIIFFRGGNRSAPDGMAQVNNERSSETRRIEWSAAEFGKASMLATMYRTFIDIWQEKEAVMQNDQLLKLLLANSAHEFRTPLNAIINYLEIALDGNLNQETRESISRSHSASKSLVYIINDLLDLTNAENGQNLIKDEVFSLPETLCEATNIFWEEARQKQVDLQVVQHSALPPVLGDQRRVRQVITNLISNAVQHTSVGAVTIESCILSESCEPGEIAIEVAIHDTGSGMPQETVETLFCQLEQVSYKGEIPNPRPCGKTEGASELEKQKASVLGLGLALVARIVRNMNGQLSLKSQEGSGSCFKIRLKFPLPEGTYSEKGSDENIDHKQGELCDEKKQEIEKSLESTEKQDTVPCHCGDETSNVQELGKDDGSLVDVDIALNSGESRSIALSSSDKPIIESSTGPNPKSKADSKPASLNILVAEDDPINSTIVRKRLEKFGYAVRMTANGKECASVFQDSPQAFDAVLMDLQMPIVDGSSATKVIREYELKQPTQVKWARGRIPVFAVSASLMERDRKSYVASGFDGWIMKPIDFQRVHVLLNGVYSSEARSSCFYQPGMWEQGGWFQVEGDNLLKAPPANQVAT